MDEEKLTADALWEAVTGKPGTQTWYESVHITWRSPEAEAARKAENERIYAPRRERAEKAKTERATEAQVKYLTTLAEKVGKHPARVMTGAAWPKRPEHSGVRGGQPGGIGKTCQQPCPGMTGHPRTIGTDVNRGTQDSLHVEGALRLDRQSLSARFIIPGQEGTFAFPPRQQPHPSETARLAFSKPRHQPPSDLIGSALPTRAVGHAGDSPVVGVAVRAVGTIRRLAGVGMMMLRMRRSAARASNPAMAPLQAMVDPIADAGVA